MKTQFDTELKAIGALQKARNKSLGYCPLIRGDCLRHCVCYYKGDIKQHAPKPDYPWNVYYPGCTNLLISGVITVEQ